MMLTNIENGKGCCREIHRFGTHSAEVRYNNSRQQAYLGGVQHPISTGRCGVTACITCHC